MALILCPDCKRKMSRKAVKCPCCGRPNDAILNQQVAVILGCVGFVFLIAILACGGFFWILVGNSEIEQEPKSNVSSRKQPDPSSAAMLLESADIVSKADPESEEASRDYSETIKMDQENVDQELDPNLANRGDTVYQLVVSNAKAGGALLFYLKPQVVSGKMLIHVPYEYWNSLSYDDRVALAHYSESVMGEYASAWTWEIVLGRIMGGEIMYDKIIVNRTQWKYHFAKYEDWSW